MNIQRWTQQLYLCLCDENARSIKLDDDRLNYLLLLLRGNTVVLGLNFNIFVIVAVKYISRYLVLSNLKSDSELNFVLSNFERERSTSTLEVQVQVNKNVSWHRLERDRPTGGTSRRRPTLLPRRQRRRPRRHLASFRETCLRTSKAQWEVLGGG